MKLTHLTMVGSNLPAASVEFGPTFTLVRGPSDTGKSFIVNAIDFVLGASALKEIPERRGYRTVMLGIDLEDGTEVTLARGVDGGAISLYSGRQRTDPKRPADVVLAGKHSATNEASVSRYLLQQVGLDGRRVRRNNRNETDSLSFRNLAHLCVVDEVQMQSDIPPALTGRPASKTKEISVLRLLLEDADDSDLVATPDNADRARLADAKTEVFDQLIQSLEEELADSDDEAALRDQLARLNASLQTETARLSEFTDERSGLFEGLRAATSRREAAEIEVAESIELHARLSLLLDQYDSDLGRLDTLGEAGSLLGFFSPGVCVFCGAAPEAQHLNEHVAEETTAFAESIRAEQEKTWQLKSDLTMSLADLHADQRAAEARAADALADSSRTRTALLALEDRLKPASASVSELVTTRERIQQQLSLYSRIQELAVLRAQVQRQVSTESTAAAARLDLGSLDDFSAVVADELVRWGYPDGADVRYDRGEQDLIAGSQLRSAHGKGVRAVLHAAFTIGLARYCRERENHHPGFVVLDSPLVTYRAPDAASADSANEALPPEFAGNFYADLQRRPVCQVIVMENTNPPDQLARESTDVVFTKSRGLGRYGFFPPGDVAASSTDN